jgi:hypothetical protein
LCGLIAFAAGYVVAAMHEERERKARDATRDRELKERDAAHEARYRDLMALAERSAADARREFSRLDSTLVSMAAQMARGVAPDSPQMRELVDSARTSVATIRDLVMHAEPGIFNVTGFPAATTVAESKTPIGMPSVPSSSAHRP